ncbi:hypothetical protein FRACA_480037 [Frankia canadensis]|uniref:Uncharacterized protein n=1 Tax=Frankia canadensis TaxID=1836972 RepID=A0A2I2KY03_9ACTN|nr:hypothetical protein FRACA_480037 [Frankia canadensis]SOU57838.1 hypothetical protein FRACA_480037 [Frankia canadensis]
MLFQLFDGYTVSDLGKYKLGLLIKTPTSLRFANM